VGALLRDARESALAGCGGRSTSTRNLSAAGPERVMNPICGFECMDLLPEVEILAP
jgi:hypothetical protein